MGSRPKFEPDLKQVEELASNGLTQAQIALVLGISERTLYKHKRKQGQFAQALKKGQACGVGDVTNALRDSALSGNVTAQIFYLKNRDSENWRDRREHETVTPPAQRSEKATPVQVAALAGWFNASF